MRTEIVQVWEDYCCFEYELNKKIKSLEQYYEIIDIKYSTFYSGRKPNYSALIIFKDKVSDK